MSTTPALRVTEPFLPDEAAYRDILQTVWHERWLTNEGPLCRRLAEETAAWLGVPHLQLVSSGTSALHLSLAGLGLSGSVVTTPYSYAATAHAALWRGLDIIFADIDADTLCLDPGAVEAVLRPDTTAILATHVFGWPCDVEALEALGRKHGVKIVYDAAHTFGTRLGGRALASYGDTAALSLHATKVFHAVEGGAVVSADAETDRRVGELKSHGVIGDTVVASGINAKMSEFHAAMGLAVLPHLERLIAHRLAMVEAYRTALDGLSLRFLAPQPGAPFDWNGAYCPIAMRSEDAVLRVQKDLRSQGIEARRYFFPALNTVPHIGLASCPVAEDAARRILCLPLSHRVDAQTVERVAGTISDSLSRTPRPKENAA